MGRQASRGGGLPLSALLSQALVAFVIEFDNAFEHEMPHRTTNHGASADSPDAPWLVSLAMWVHCMRDVPSEGIGTRDLARAAGLDARGARMVFKRMSRWWGYLEIDTVSSGARGGR
ncbi:MAG: hypothetical protein ACR2NR_21210 [Solirubrobacteraceae bacterium]